MEVVAADNLFSFFYDRVRTVREAQKVEVKDDTEFYLVNLLVEYGRAVRLVEVDGRRVDDRPLAIRLLESRRCPTGSRLRDLKHLADSTLYVLGFFSDSLVGSTVNLGYYAGVAESAYSDLATMTGSRRRSVADSTFHELSEKFSDCVDLLNEVAMTRLTDSGLLDLYERWLASGNERAERKLRALGLLPPEPDWGGGVTH